MTTNKPEVVAYLHEPATTHPYATLTVDRHESGSPAPLIRLSDCEALQAECEKLRSKTELTLGVGDGNGNLFVHGDYDSIKRVQALIFECEKLRKDAERLDWLEEQTRQSWTGVSFDHRRHVEDGYVLENGYRFMRRHYRTDFSPSIRAAIDATMIKEREK